MESTSATLTATAYASFGRRLGAWLIDVVVLWIVQAIVITPILGAIGFGIVSDAQSMQGMTEDQAAEAVGGMIGTIMATMGTMMLVTSVLNILYFALMESSKTQGSIGKMALGIKVTDMNGNRISIGTGFLRAIGKIISGAIIFIGYLMAAFTEKKQGLHDIIASTLVQKK